MQTFTDTANRKWEIVMSLGSVKQLKDCELQVDLLALDMGEPPLLTRLGMDIMLLCDCIYVLVREQLDKAGISDEEFGASLGGESILKAREAFFSELANFFQGLGRTDLVKAIQKQEEVVSLAIQRVEMVIDEVDLEKLIEEHLPGKSSTNSQESSE